MTSYLVSSGPGVAFILEAKHVIVVMGSGAVTCSETAQYLQEKGQKAQSFPCGVPVPIGFFFGVPCAPFGFRLSSLSMSVSFPLRGRRGA